MQMQSNTTNAEMATIDPAKAEVIARWEQGCYTQVQRQTVADFKEQTAAQVAAFPFRKFVVMKAQAMLVAAGKWTGHIDSTFKAWLKEVGEVLNLIADASEKADKTLWDYLRIDMPMPRFNSDAPVNPEDTEEPNDLEVYADKSGLLWKIFSADGDIFWRCDDSLLVEIAKMPERTTCQQFINQCTSPDQLFKLAAAGFVPYDVRKEAEMLTRGMGAAEAMDFFRGDYNYFTGCIISYLNGTR